MSLSLLVDHAVNKQNFQTVDDYIQFCTRYLEFVETGLQARIISQNEIHYQFFQYKEDGSFNITRPLNSCLMYDAHNFEVAAQIFRQTLSEIRAAARPSDENRESVIRSIYTIQQTIGAALDALPSGMSNKARKINGDLFEKFICMLIASLGVDCVSGVVHVRHAAIVRPPLPQRDRCAAPRLHRQQLSQFAEAVVRVRGTVRLHADRWRPEFQHRPVIRSSPGAAMGNQSVGGLSAASQNDDRRALRPHDGAHHR